MSKAIGLRTLILAAATAAFPGVSTGGQEPSAAGPSVPLSDPDREAFLLQAEVVKTKSAPGGITGSTRATLKRNGVVHDAHIQVVDEYKTQVQLSSGLEIDFRDSWRNNVAAYRLDRLLGLGMVPVTVVRSHDRKPASFTWWVDDVIMDEKKRFQQKISSPDPEAWNCQIFVVRLFDQLIYNVDRNLGNLLIDKDWRLWMIDHTRGFKIFKELKNEKNLGARGEKDLLAALRRLEKTPLRAATKDLLTEAQVDALLTRRDRIVRIYDERVAAQGEEAVLYDLPDRMTLTATAR